MKPTTTSWLLALVLVLGFLLTGCQSNVRMTRPDTTASLERPESWPREVDAEQSGTLFQIRHPSEPVRIRLSRLETPIIEQAHEPWARLWLGETFDDASVETIEESAIGVHDAQMLRSRVVDAGEALTHELFLSNASAETFLLEAWGHPEAMERTELARQEITASLQLPTGASDGVSPAERVELAERGFRLVLPETQNPQVHSQWQVERPGDQRVVFKLASRLIEGEIFVEELDYPIDAVTYAETALGIELEDEVEDRHDVRLWDVLEGDHPVEMRTSRRFLTRGERAVQIAVSTPVALYATNSEVIDALLDSLELADE